MLVSLVWFIYFILEQEENGWCGYLHFLGFFNIVNFIAPYSIVYSEIVELKQLSLPWGELYTIAIGTDQSIKIYFRYTSVLIVIFIIDASIRLWKKGNKRRAFWIGGAHYFLFFWLEFIHHLSMRE